MAENGHLFGRLLDKHLSRKRGLTSRWLAEQINAYSSDISHMRKGERLSNRQRILDIITCFHKEGILADEGEATALLEAAGLCRLLPEELPEIPRSAPQPPSARFSTASERELGGRWGCGRDVSESDRQSGGYQRRVFAFVLALVVVTVATSVFVVSRIIEDQSPAVIWQEDFDPIQESRWMQVSARWHDVPGPTAALVENNPDQSFGKVETEVIAVDADAHPKLRVNVTDVMPGTRYSVQILDKRTDEARDILAEIDRPGEHTVDIAAEMGWQGLQAFTINIWIGGEGGSISFDLVSVEADDGT